MEDFAAVLGCKIGALPTDYLGMVIGTKFRSKQIWEPVIERCRKRLDGWKANYLSKGARITLIKSVLSSLPTYFFSLFPAPVSVLKEIGRLQRNFLWGRSEGVFKHNLVDWQMVCNPIQMGGAGIRQLKLHNKALRGKWLWRFAKEEGSLWRRMIEIKYGVLRGGWTAATGPASFGASLWRSLSKIWPEFERCLSWKVGRGERILFWKHNWLTGGRLSDAFPDIFAIALDENALIADYLTRVGSNMSWNVKLRRNLNDWEVESFRALMEVLYSCSMVDSADVMRWKQSPNDDFSVISFYKVLLSGEDDSFPWKNIWKAPIPTRVIFFSWCAIRGKILTMDNLKRRGYSLANRCPMCLRQEESIAHLLLHCEWVTEIWSLVLSCFGVQMCLPSDLKSLLLNWWEQSMSKWRRKIWNAIPYCLFWLTWKERNRRIFDNSGRTVMHSKSVFLSCLFSWVKEGIELDLNSFLIFIDSMK